jgi:hypothetical protein
LTYTHSITPSSGSNFITFDALTRQITIYTNENQYGDETYYITVTGTNSAGVAASSNPIVVMTVRDCSQATIDIDSSQNTTLEHRMVAYTTDITTYQIDNFFTTNDTQCEMSYQMFYDSSNQAMFSDWTDNSYELDTSYT